MRFETERSKENKETINYVATVGKITAGKENPQKIIIS